MIYQYRSIYREMLQVCLSEENLLKKKKKACNFFTSWFSLLLYYRWYKRYRTVVTSPLTCKVTSGNILDPSIALLFLI